MGVSECKNAFVQTVGKKSTGSGCDPPRETDYEPGLWSQPERHLGASITRHTYNLNLRNINSSCQHVNCCAFQKHQLRLPTRKLLLLFWPPPLAIFPLNSVTILVVQFTEEGLRTETYETSVTRYGKRAHLTRKIFSAIFVRAYC